MSSTDIDKVFTGSIPQLYETYLVPLIFAPYAPDLANRLAATPATRVLEIAAGTGVVTRALASILPDRNEIEARDPSSLAQATEVAAKAIAGRFRTGPGDGKIQAHIVTIEKGGS